MTELNLMLVNFLSNRIDKNTKVDEELSNKIKETSDFIKRTKKTISSLKKKRKNKNL